MPEQLPPAYRSSILCPSRDSNRDLRLFENSEVWDTAMGVLYTGKRSCESAAYEERDVCCSDGRAKGATGERHVGPRGQAIIQNAHRLSLRLGELKHVASEYVVGNFDAFRDICRQITGQDCRQRGAARPQAGQGSQRPRQDRHDIRHDQKLHIWQQ